MSSSPSFANLMDQLRSGDSQAAEQIFRRFAHELILLAGHRLSALLRQKVDAEDVIQSVFRSFFRRNVERPWDLDGWDSLWRLLTTITLYKCGHRFDYFRAARRDVQREVSFQPGGDESGRHWEAIARDPSPSEAAILTETVEQLMRSLEDRDRDILELSLQGESVIEISKRLDCSERTVERGLNRIRKRLQRMQAATREGA
jgi:RNA polymerase sigma-70 factor (ECF subfamily)